MPRGAVVAEARSTSPDTQGNFNWLFVSDPTCQADIYKAALLDLFLAEKVAATI